MVQSIINVNVLVITVVFLSYQLSCNAFSAHRAAVIQQRHSVTMFTKQYNYNHCNNKSIRKLDNINNNSKYNNALFVRSADSDADTDTDSDESLISPRRIAYLLTWITFVTYAFTIAPGGNTQAEALDANMIKTMISTPFDGTISPIFVALFNSLGILPAIYASLLLPGGKKQQIPTLPFVISSFALGFFGIGPYLGIRSINTNVTNATRGRGSGVFEFKATSIGMLLFGLYLIYYAINGTFDGDRVKSYIELFQNQKLVHVSSLDFTILSIALIDPLKEDMKRRNFKFNYIYLFPIFGPVIYLLLRPSLKDE